MQRKVFLGIQTLGMIQKKSPAQKAGLDHSSRLNLTLAGCSSAEPDSVSVQQCKIQIINLYLQPVKIISHLPIDTTGKLMTNFQKDYQSHIFIQYTDKEHSSLTFDKYMGTPWRNASMIPNKDGTIRIVNALFGATVIYEKN